MFLNAFCPNARITLAGIEKDNIVNKEKRGVVICNW